MFKKVKESVSAAKVYMTRKTLEAKLAAGEIVQDENGNFFTEHGVAIVIVLVVGALVLVVMSALWADDGTIVTSINREINEMFGLV